MIMRQIDGGEATQTGQRASILLEMDMLEMVLLVGHRSWVGFEP